MSFESREFRDALGKFATGVCIITAEPKGGKPMGMTVNSFASLSLDPPLILWSIQNDSECLPAFENNIEYFAVNILEAEHEAESNRYAKRGDHDLAEDIYFMGETGVPVLKGPITYFECRIDTIHDGGDHKIIVGRVEAMQDNSAGDPLLFYSGKYRGLK